MSIDVFCLAWAHFFFNGHEDLKKVIDTEASEGIYPGRAKNWGWARL